MHITSTPAQIQPRLVLSHRQIDTVLWLQRQRIRRLVTTVVTAACLILSANALAEQLSAVTAQTGQIDQAQQSKHPKIPEAVLSHVIQGEQDIDYILAHNEPLNAEQAQALIKAAETFIQVRTQSQGEQWWETLDARHRLIDFRKWLTFRPSQRAEQAERAETNQQVQTLTREGKSKEAFAPAEKLLDIDRRLWGEGHRNLAASLNNLAMLYQAQGQYLQAEPLYKQARGIVEQTMGSTHPEMARSLNNLAALYHAQGAYTKARPLYERALAIREQALGPTHPETARGLNNLAWLNRDQGQYAKAESLLKRALAISEQSLGPEHLQTAKSLNNLAALHQTQGAYTLAEPLYVRAGRIFEQTLGPAHPETAQNLNNLAMLYEAQGAYTQARPLYEQALSILEQALGPTHPVTARNLNNLAMLYEAQGAYTQAEPLLKRALSILEQALGPTHPFAAGSLNDLAMLYYAQGAYTQARPLLERALAIREQALGPIHPATATSLNNLATLYAAQGAYTQAESLLKRALAIQEQVLGPIHPATATSLVNLGILLTVYQPDVQASEWLHRFAQSRWRYLTESFPVLTPRQQQQFLTKHALDVGGYLWHVLMQVPNVDRAIGYQVTLWIKQLLAEAARHENSAFQHVFAKAPAEWQELWREREALRRIYATRALHELQDMNTMTLHQGGTSPVVSSTRDLAIHIEDLEQRLRRENPAYAKKATLQNITVAQVQRALKPDQALLEYVQFHPYDDSTKQLAKALHYGVYVVRGGQTKVGAVDLGDAAPIDAAIREFRTVMLKQEQRSKEKITPSSKQLLEEEAQLAKASATLRQLVWQPVETVLTTVTRVYVAPDGQLSVFPFEALAQQTVRGTWQYLVEEREIVYLNTGRDLARLALTANAEPASNVSPRTAVLIGNPKFDAQPHEVVKVVAGLSTMTPRESTRGTPGSSGTLGPSASQDAFRIPRNWPQEQEIDTLLTHAEQHLQDAQWTVTTWRDLTAVEAAVLRLQAPRILQFATHGYFLESANPEKTGSWDNPLLRSMLLLAGVNRATPEQSVFYRVGNKLLTEMETQQRQLSSEARQQTRIDIGDGILTAYEVTGMNLAGTELVNLTACKTGLGEATSEGVVGLRQAFFFAGARALTTSLWEVPVDEATKQLKDFYSQWLGTTKGKIKMARYAAFRQTQLAALNHTRKTYGAGHPYFWAGFIYLGDPGDLPVGSRAIPNTKVNKNKK